MRARRRAAPFAPFGPAGMSHPDEAEGPDVTPILDVVFILLIFFIVAAAFAVRGMDVELPPVKNSRPLAGRILELRLDADGTLSCEGKTLTPQALGEFLRYRAETDRLAGITQPRNLVLRAAPTAPVAALVRIVDVVRSMGGNKLVIATGQHGVASPNEPDSRRGSQ